MLYACKIICFIRIGEIRIGTQRSSAHFRACIFALGYHTIRKIIHKSGIRICIMIRDLRYAAVISVRISYRRLMSLSCGDRFDLSHRKIFILKIYGNRKNTSLFNNMDYIVKTRIFIARTIIYIIRSYCFQHHQ